ncbi:hypothetical protein K6119_16645 [Paracrocinitomix mangrovi]|uniref:hypothetical protein n=1 Tax=Paracrocinitomix mangrovi TaxID=2862509 RepID=UPI001EDA5CE4|nr:hypothetical protein [Paracrocinitomix mangrovi]UKN01357.1 hypothetical protein K6119_16645 [Paracrocinitomix mangrovi]
MKFMFKHFSTYLASIVILTVSANNVKAQTSPDIYKGGLKVNLNDDGSKYFRLISWAQIQAIYADGAGSANSNVTLNLRRARVLMYSQISKKFLILTHFGLNSLNRNTLSPTGTGPGSQLFFHDVWGQYSIGENHAVGAGLHYFNGISRLNNQSTLNMMTLDNNRQSWATIGLSDQFARHLGVFGKGSIGKLQYRLAINDALTNTLDTRDPVYGGSAVYAGKKLIGSRTAGFTYAGYFEYQFLDKESNFLPYKVGTYVGKKKVLNLGAGFFLHPNGSVIMTDTLGTLAGENVGIFAGDVFFEYPIGSNNSAISAYATFQYNNYGRDYLYSAYGTGNMIYGHLGYVVPGKAEKPRLQPYVSYALNSYDASPDNRTVLGVGTNLYLTGHHSKLTLEYQRQQFGTTVGNAMTLQAMIYL